MANIPIFDAGSNGIAYTATTVNVNHTCSGANRYMFLGTSFNTSGATYAGVSLSNIYTFTPSGSPFGANCPALKLWGLADPALGTNTLAVTTVAGETFCAASYSNVSPDTWLGATNDKCTYPGQDTFISQTLNYDTTYNWNIGLVAITNILIDINGDSHTVRRAQQQGDYLASGTIALFDSNANPSNSTQNTMTGTCASGSAFISIVMMELEAFPFTPQMIIL